MSEIFNDKRIFSLSEVTSSIQKTINDRYKNVFWVKAEMNKLNHYPYSGHCYPELVQKKDGRVIAEIKSNLWKDDYLRVNRLFLQVLKEPLRDGINILFCAKVNYDPVHGLSLRIIDIDPSFSLGEIEREKQESISRLRSEAIHDANKLLKLALLPKRIAIISVGTSKGYADFLKMINDNPWGYRFFLMLFPAVLQGSQAVPSIVGQLQQIRKVKDHFDAVAIVRGGGGDIGLTCYNHFDLAKEICLFPLPVITGIGHATNETVSEMIAFKNAITPTDLAGYLLQLFHDFSFPLQDATRVLQEEAGRLLKTERSGLFNTVRHFRSATGSLLQRRSQQVDGSIRAFRQSADFFVRKQKEVQRLIISGLNRNSELICTRNQQDIRQLALVLQKDVKTSLKNSSWVLDIFTRQLAQASTALLASDKQRLLTTTALLSGKAIEHLGARNIQLANTEKLVSLVDPREVLKRGYSITMAGNKVLKTAAALQQGDELTTMLADGTIVSSVTQMIKQESNE
jgi:exodeoxyribonuclease VII large subunit